MSQVVVVEDNLKQKRMQSKKQESSIDKDGFVRKWQMSDISKPSFVLKLIGIATAPIVIFWSFLGLLISLAVGLCVFCFKILARLTPKYGE